MDLPGVISTGIGNQTAKSNLKTKKRWQHKGFSASFVILNSQILLSLNLGGTTTKASKLPQIGLLIRVPTTLIMPRIQEKIKRLFGVLLPINTVCSGTIAGSPKSDTTPSVHSFKKSSNKGCNSISPYSPQNTTTNREFSAVGFEAEIGGAV